MKVKPGTLFSPTLLEVENGNFGGWTLQSSGDVLFFEIYTPPIIMDGKMVPLILYNFLSFRVILRTETMIFSNTAIFHWTMIYGEELVNILCISWTWLQSSGDALFSSERIFYKGPSKWTCITQFWGTKPSPPPKNIGNKKTDGALQKRNDAVLFCCPRGRGVSSCFVIFGCCSCFKKGFHFKCVGSTSSWSVLHISANVWDSLLWEKPHKTYFIIREFGIPESRIVSPFFHGRVG